MHAWRACAAPAWLTTAVPRLPSPACLLRTLQNILVDKDFKLRVADFGLAKLTSSLSHTWLKSVSGGHWAAAPHPLLLAASSYRG